MINNEYRGDGIITNPAELALPYAAISWGSLALEASTHEKDALVELVSASEVGQMHDTYFVDASNGYVIPRDATSGGWFGYTRFDQGVIFEGHFDTFSIVKIGQIEEADTVVRALCLLFEQSMLVTPTFMPVEQEDLLLIPVLAVNEMSKRPGQ